MSNMHLPSIGIEFTWFMVYGLQGYLAHQKTLPPNAAYAKGPRGSSGGERFLLGEVPIFWLRVWGSGCPPTVHAYKATCAVTTTSSGEVFAMSFWQCFIITGTINLGSNFHPAITSKPPLDEHLWTCKRTCHATGTRSTPESGFLSMAPMPSQWLQRVPSPWSATPLESASHSVSILSPERESSSSTIYWSEST